MENVDKTAIGVMDVSAVAQAVPAEDATQMAMNVDCPVCRTPNPPSETYCIDCGFLLASQPEIAATGGTGFEITPQQFYGKLVTPDGTREFMLNPGQNTVGRENADILLSHNTVSRKHATITVADDRVYVEDVGSTNGTTVAGAKIAPGEKVDLTNGCEIVFGSFALRYEAAESGERRAESEGSEKRRVESEETPSPGGEGGGEGAAQAEGTHSVPCSPSPVPSVGRLVSKDGIYSFDIHDGTNTIGRREADNDIVISDPYCSGRHADLTFAEGRFTITDVGSTNGTLVNGEKLDPHVPRELSDGDEITLGRTVFTVTIASEERS